MELLSKGTQLSYSTAAEGTFKTLYGLNSTPDMGGKPDKIDVTNLSDTIKRSIRGLKDPGDLDFGFYYNTADTSISESMVRDSYATLRALDKSGAVVYFKLTYPDGTGFAFNGQISVIRAAAEVNQALKFTLSVAAQSDLEDITPTQSAAAAPTVPQAQETE